MQGIEVGGEVPEISLQLSNGMRLRSMVMVTGDPEWSIRLPDGRYLDALAGRIHLGDGSHRAYPSEESALMLQRADQATERWQRPRQDPAGGDCRACAFFAALDGDDALLDYGVCTSGASRFDGRVIHRLSGCPAYEPA